VQISPISHFGNFQSDLKIQLESPMAVETVRKEMEKDVRMDTMMVYMDVKQGVILE